MVAYSFQSAFIDDIVARTKRQTIRRPRKRHARPGERIQLFAGMRTRHCRKIIPDPVCVGVDEVRIDLRRFVANSVVGDRAQLAAAPLIEVNGIPLSGEDADRYAVGDGFGGRRLPPFEFMIRWWLATHGPVLFDGVAIRWEDRP